MTVSTATAIRTIELGAVVDFRDGVQTFRGVVVEQGLTHRNDGFVHDYPANVPCLVVRVHAREYRVLASQLVHVHGVQVCQEGRVFCRCCI